MPIWLKVLERAVHALIFVYGHQAVLEKVVKATP
jgi:hypothetical protein